MSSGQLCDTVVDVYKARDWMNASFVAMLQYQPEVEQETASGTLCAALHRCRIVGGKARQC